MQLTKDQNGELLFPASVIDDAMLCLAGYCEGKPDAFVRFCLRETFILLCIRVQTENEDEFYAALDKVWLSYQSGQNQN